MYRPSARAPRGAWANHLHAQRRERGLSSQQAFELVYERLGLSPKSRAVYTALDMGDRQPRPEEAEVLAAEFGWPPEGLQATETPDDLIAALRAQTDAITALVGELRQARERDQDVASAILQAAEVLGEVTLERPTRGGGGASRGRGVPLGSAR